MNIDELKKLVKHSTAVLVLDNGEPSFAILNYDMYKDLVLGNREKEIKINHNAVANGLSPERSREDLPRTSAMYGISHDEDGVSLAKSALPDSEFEILERINKDILALKSEIEKEEKVLMADSDSLA